MLEILAIIYLSKKIGAMAAEKGHSRALYITLFVILWVFGELTGGVFGFLLGGEQNPVAYLLGLAGAAFGAIIGYIVVDNLPDCSREEDDLELDRTGRPLQQPAWNAEHFQQGRPPSSADSDHIQLKPQAARSGGNADSDSTGIQKR